MFLSKTLQWLHFETKLNIPKIWQKIKKRPFKLPKTEAQISGTLDPALVVLPFTFQLLLRKTRLNDIWMTK